MDTGRALRSGRGDALEDGTRQRQDGRSIREREGVGVDVGGPEAAESVTAQRLAERGGFEPPVQVLAPYNRLAICPVQPLQHLSA